MYRIALTTAPSVEEAHTIANALVDGRLAACVNIVPQVESIYRWEGKVESATELLLVIKTTEERWPEVRDKILGIHSYATPECICFEVADGSQAYFEWITASTH
jgi:periplasmic divalent cation tolerance protein